MSNVYFPPAIPVAEADLINLISQLPPPLILIGDFTAESILWVSVLTDDRGHIVSNLCSGFELILLNMGADVHLCLGSGASALDLAFCSPVLAVHLE